MSNRLGQFGKTTAVAVTASAPGSPWTPPEAPTRSTAGGVLPIEWKGRYVVSSDVDMHIQRNADAAATSAPRIPAGTLVEIEMTNTDTLSFIRAASATGNGTIWITKV